MFVRRDAEAAAKDLGRMLDDVTRRMGGPPKAALYVSCVARGSNLFGPNSEEAKTVRAALGEDAPLIGFFANGEISKNRLYGYTGVLTVFSDEEDEMRLFTALAVPEEHRARLSALAAGVDGARWVAPENLHVTLRFIGEVNEAAGGDVAEALAGGVPVPSP